MRGGSLKTVLLFAFFVALHSTICQAADSAAAAGNLPATSAPAEGAETESQAEGSGLLKKFEENHEITDARMRAASGSLTRLSMRFSLGYFGPPVGDLGALNQPNPDDLVAKTATAISGSMGLRYRFDSQQSLSLIVGVSDNYPLRPEQQFDVNNPQISYTDSFRWGNVQMLSAPGISMSTEKVFTAKGQTLGINYGLESIYNLGMSDFALTSDENVSWNAFNRAFNPKPPRKGGDGNVRRLSMGVSPGMKYYFNRRLSAQTSVGFSFYNLRGTPSIGQLENKTISQRVGVGYAFTRDVFVSPFLNFYPTKPALRTTTVNVATVFSVL
jgi:hypothetical protein